MTWSKHPRLLTPAISALSGATIAFAFGIRQGWGSALLVECLSLGLATVLYMAGGSDTDSGAILGQRDDERQHLVGLQAARLALVVVLAGVVIACVIAAAANYPFWPFEVLADLMGLSYVIGLRIYGVSAGDPAISVPEDANARASE